MEIIKYQTQIKPVTFNEINDQFTICKCYVMAIGKNRNFTYISKESVDVALPTLSYSPVVANLLYDEDEDRYYVGGHDREIENGKLCDITVPYGVVIANSFGYEDVEESSGAVSTYLTCDIVLWTGRYGDLMKAAYDDSIYFGQSMEIIPLEVVQYAQDKRYSDIQSFKFSCLTLLGKSDDPEHHVEPCFPSARVQTYSCIDLSSSCFVEKFEELKSAMRDAFVNSHDGINTLSKEAYPLTKIEILNKYNLTPENCGFDYEQFSEEDLEAKLSEQFSTSQNEGNSSEGEPTDPQLQNFNLNTLELVREISIELSKEKISTEYGWEFSRYWLVEVQENEVIAEDLKDHGRKYAIPFAMDGDYVSLDFDSKSRVKTTYAHYEGEALDDPFSPLVEFYSFADKQIMSLSNELNETKTSLSHSEEKYSELNEKYAEISGKYENLNKEVQESERNAVIKKFDAELSGVEEYEALKCNTSISANELEEKCFAIIGKKKFSYVPNTFQSNDSTVVFGVQQSAPAAEANMLYGGLREKYLKNH